MEVKIDIVYEGSYHNFSFEFAEVAEEVVEVVEDVEEEVEDQEQRVVDVEEEMEVPA